MSPNVIVAVAALLLSLITGGVILAPIRTRLNACEKERFELRRRLEIVTAVIIQTLPREKRIDLLAQLNDRIPPVDDYPRAA